MNTLTTKKFRFLRSFGIGILLTIFFAFYHLNFEEALFWLNFEVILLFLCMIPALFFNKLDVVMLVIQIVLFIPIVGALAGFLFIGTFLFEYLLVEAALPVEALDQSLFYQAGKLLFENRFWDAFLVFYHNIQGFTLTSIGLITFHLITGFVQLRRIPVKMEEKSSKIKEKKLETNDDLFLYFGVKSLIYGVIAMLVGIIICILALISMINFTANDLLSGAWIIIGFRIGIEVFTYRISPPLSFTNK